MIAPCFSQGQLEQLARLLGEEVTGSTLSLMLEQAKLVDHIELSTKWKRIYNAFAYYQNDKQCSNQIMNFIKLIIDPARYINRAEDYANLLIALNKILAFVGFEVKDDGKIYQCNKANTLSEAEQRATSLKKKLEQQNAHHMIFKYCNAELLADNYFHAVFEANKGLFDRIRELSGLSTDGITLLQEVFSSNPILIINNYRSSSEKNEHTGFGNILKGLCGMFRNPEAHEPKIYWSIGEQDALEILGMISYCHRRLDNAHKIRIV